MKNLLLIFCILAMSPLYSQAAEFGMASYYGNAFHGKKTANGETYNKNGMTAAHKTLPFGTMIRVTRTDNKKSVVLRVTDRGPFYSGRIVEVSNKAAGQLNLIQDGVAPVKVEVLKDAPATQPQVVEKTTPAKTETKTTKPKDVPKAANVEAALPVSQAVEDAKKAAEEARLAAIEAEKAAKLAEEAKAKAQAAAVAKAKAAKAAEKAVTGKDYKEYDLYKIQLVRPEKAGYGVQVAYLTDYENVFKQVADLQEDFFKNVLMSVEKGKDDTQVYKIILGPFPTIDQANAYKKSLLKKNKIKGFVVNLEGM